MVFRWGNNEKRKLMKGRECTVISRGKMQSICIEFVDTRQREIVSRRAVY